LGSCTVALYLIAGLCAVGAVLLLVAAFNARNKVSTATDSSEMVSDEMRFQAEVITDQTEACEAVVVGVFMCSFAAGLGALRDMARNSFK
jgi:hypothetical protein